MSMPHSGHKRLCYLNAPYKPHDNMWFPLQQPWEAGPLRGECGVIKVRAALTKDVSSIPSTQVRHLTTTCNSNQRVRPTRSASTGTCVLSHALTPHTDSIIYVIKYNKKKSSKKEMIAMQAHCLCQWNIALLWEQVSCRRFFLERESSLSPAFSSRAPSTMLQHKKIFTTLSASWCRTFQTRKL